MDDYYPASPIANRDEPIPVIRTASHDDDAATTSASESEAGKSKRDRVKDKASGIKDKLSDYGSPSLSIQDRLLSGLMAQIIPPEDLSETETPAAAKSPKDRRSRKYVDRPGFSVGLMSSNFRRFNSRVGIVFVFQNRLIHLFTWRAPTQTLGFLACYTLLCLNPQLLPLVPLVLALFFIMVPAFLARHPTPEGNDPMIGLSRYGPAHAPPSRIKPAPEMSKDFFRNMRDLQNCMEDFSRVHDLANEYVTPYTDFSDEGMSSTLFLALATIASAAFVSSQLVPWRAVALIAGWTATLACHPDAQKVLLSTRNLSQLRQQTAWLGSQLRAWIDSDIVLDEPAEVREVEIFELQKHHAATDTWEAWLFSRSPYDPLSPSRIAGARAKGTQFFEDVQPPSYWSWKDKKWNLDLWSREWVESRMITGVEIETEGERWVYDVPMEELQLSPRKGGKKRELPKAGWEEGTGLEARGEWRRRRWVRRVERKIVKLLRRSEGMRTDVAKAAPRAPRPSPLAMLDPAAVNPGIINPSAIT